MKIRFIALAALSAFTACQQPRSAGKRAEAVKVVPESLLVSCKGIGKVLLSDSYASLLSKFGQESLSVHENNTKGLYHSVKEGSPGQLNVFWKEKRAPFVHILRIETFAENAPYMTADSVRVGMSMRELVNKNGHMPLSFNNVYADEDPGLIRSFNDGNISKRTACLSGRIDAGAVNNVHVEELKAFKKRKELRSSDDLLNRIETSLGAFVITAKQ